MVTKLDFQNDPGINKPTARTVSVGPSSFTDVKLHQIQGSTALANGMLVGVLGGADESPMLGQDVRIQAVVTQVMPTLGGYYVQEEGADADVDASSWEGIFVRGPFEGIDAGDLVTVEGRVSEVGGETSITAARTTVDGVAELPKATLVTFPTATVLRAITLPTLKPMRACLSRYSTNDRGRAVPD